MLDLTNLLPHLVLSLQNLSLLFRLLFWNLHNQRIAFIFCFVVSNSGNVFTSYQRFSEEIDIEELIEIFNLPVL